mmetsp:Transcript_42843/g.100453  ORF Transcript_42843/g.100453 Transcript_42843/m.100453 type:complete len:143 (-) Transcript_42843:534-962(-)
MLLVEQHGELETALLQLAPTEATVSPVTRPCRTGQHLLPWLTTQGPASLLCVSLVCAFALDVMFASGRCYHLHQDMLWLKSEDFWPAHGVLALAAAEWHADQYGELACGKDASGRAVGSGCWDQAGASAQWNLNLHGLSGLC